MSLPTKVIDCDVHNALTSPLELVPYLPEPFATRLRETGMMAVPNGWYSPAGPYRKDAIPPSGGAPGSDPDFVYEHLVKPYNMAYAMLLGDRIMNICNHPDADYASALASAYNNWMIDKWLGTYKEFKGALVVAPQDPHAAAREIDRLGGHPDIVQVMMGTGARMGYGQRFYHPIYEAAQRQGLPIILHPGAEGSGVSNAPTAAGYPSSYLEWHTSLSQNYMAHLLSLICEGVFAKYPGLKVVLAEGGIGWLPHLMWRLDKNYKALRAQVPWLTRMPSEYVRDHCFLTTQPIEEPADAKHLAYMFEMIDAENILLFSSDYPHWDFDAPPQILRKLSEEAREKIFYRNAKVLYQL
ncbi:amidohydrolase family protein [Paenibacillus roseipurpureus]|uniref:Amidohydrolase family protein n=1 Tax=Paenibacillus roseopurpureus TaxID=2918901 RepID=A0AA96RM34_9BACL|nr:amidohydrolase family protein [Paenibacillus sp. MBLB1832]WNR46039.1 amidohydrolase family protein [Paenibacillus sp. MBLB1832]